MFARSLCRKPWLLRSGSRPVVLLAIAVTLGCLDSGELAAQIPSSIQYGDKVPQDVKLIYDRGLKYLASTQQEDGSWQGGRSGGGITGLGLMAFLARGDDPNFGPYSTNVRRAVRKIINYQDSRTGYIKSSMYDHGFGMLGLAEAYGAVDDTLLWDSGEANNKRSIGKALELAVGAALQAQKNNRVGGWRYSPTSKDADTSVSGAMLMGLLAARNAGIEVPNESIDKALKYFNSCTSDTGLVAYSGGMSHGASMNRSSIATLVMAVGKRKEAKEYKATLGYISSQLDHNEMGYFFYFRYYMSQALFQGDFEAWMKWKRENTLILREMQADDGSFQASHGAAYGTAMALLSLALDYRFLPIYER